MPINQGHLHREVLSHPHQGVVDGCISMRVVLTENLANNPSTLPIRPITGQAQLIHRVEDATVNRFESIASIRQGTPDNHAHRVLQIGARHLVTQVSLDNPIVGLSGNATTGSHWIRHTKSYLPSLQVISATDGLSHQINKIHSKYCEGF
ncbi:MAG: Uncharacterised protein [Prochlorococcus marinus str. MIT 9215]|nr:MAG: Uncharacterised protein [Prochlorococcus marinus str. MIT 9215]